MPAVNDIPAYVNNLEGYFSIINAVIKMAITWTKWYFIPVSKVLSLLFASKIDLKAWDPNAPRRTPSAPNIEPRINRIFCILISFAEYSTPYTNYCTTFFNGNSVIYTHSDRKLGNMHISIFIFLTCFK